MKNFNTQSFNIENDTFTFFYLAYYTQAELRFPIFWILGGVVFGGLGQVAPKYEQLALNELHYTYGFGLRLKVDSEHDVTRRFDFGFSNDQKIFMMNFSEAF